MPITVETLLRGPLDGLAPETVCEGEAPAAFESVCLGGAAPQERCLYIRPASGLSETPETFPAGAGLIVLRDAPLPAWASDGMGTVCISVSGDVGAQALLSRIQAALDAPRIDAASVHSIMDVAAQGELGDMLECICRLIGRCAAVLDPELKMLSFAEAGEAKPAGWAYMKKSGYFQHYDVLSSLTDGGVFALEGDRLRRVQPGEPCRGEILVPLPSDSTQGKPAGYLYIGESGRVASGDYLHLLQFFAEALSCNLRRFPLSASMGDAMLSSLLEGVLNGAMSDNEAIESFLKRTRYTPKKRCALIVIQARSGDLMTAQRLPACYWKLFSDIWESCHPFFFDSGLVLLVSGDDDALLRADCLCRLDEQLLRHDCVAGISDVFSSLDTYMRYYYQRACAALHVARVIPGRTKHYLRFKDVIFHYLIKYGTTTSARLLVNPRLLVLYEYDRQFATEYLLTLRYFWLCDKNSNKICTLMHIHRNTLFYRLKKIRQIMQMDFQTVESMQDLQLSFALLERSGVIPFVTLPIEDICAEEPTDV